jgi:hypothetical protein
MSSTRRSIWRRGVVPLGLEERSRKYSVSGFVQGLMEAGFFEGQNVTIEYRWGISARPEALRAFDAAPGRANCPAPRTSLPSTVHPSRGRRPKISRQGPGKHCSQISCTSSGLRECSIFGRTAQLALIDTMAGSTGGNIEPAGNGQRLRYAPEVGCLSKIQHGE